MNRILGDKYEMCSDSVLYNTTFRVKKKNNEEFHIIKMIRLENLVQSTVNSVVTKMKMINRLNNEKIMKYETIELMDDKLIIVQPEMSICLERINPVKYFEINGPHEVLYEILLGLKSLHNSKTIHGDLKPSNIFLYENGKVVINDYCNNLLYKGKEGERNRKEKDLCFVCIDELMGKELDISSDTWNFGLVFYYIMSGKYPFVGSNVLETMKNIENIDYKPLECEYADELNTYVNSVLCKEKKYRLKLDETITELKKLNELHLKVKVDELYAKPKVPVNPFNVESQFQIPINPIDIRPRVFSVGNEVKEKEMAEEIKKKINDEINKCKNNEGNDLNFYFVKVNDEGMTYLYSRLYIMRNVTSINMTCNGFGKNGFNTFSECLKYFPNLEELCLNENSIGSYDINILLKNLYYIPNLKSLKCIRCRLRSNDMKLLMLYIYTIPNIECLCISSNKIGDEGVKYLCEYIYKLPNLRIFTLDGNEIGDDGAEKLLNNLHKCKELQKLNIFRNKISNYEEFKTKIKDNHPNKKNLEVN